MGIGEELQGLDRKKRIKRLILALLFLFLVTFLGFSLSFLFGRRMLMPKRELPVMEKEIKLEKRVPVSEKVVYYRVSFGSFQTRKEAEKISTLLLKKDFENFIKDLGEEGFLVQVGLFKEERWAKDLVLKLAKKKFQAKISKIFEGS